MNRYSVSSVASFCQAICLATEPDLANSKFSIYSSITPTLGRRILLEKLTVMQSFKRLLIWNSLFITVTTRTHHQWNLSWAM